MVSLRFPSGVDVEMIITYGVAADSEGEMGCVLQTCGGVSLGIGDDEAPGTVAGNFVVGVMGDGDICNLEGSTVGLDLDTFTGVGGGIEAAFPFPCFWELFTNSNIYTFEVSFEVASTPDSTIASVAVGFCWTWIIGDTRTYCRNKSDGF